MTKMRRFPSDDERSDEAGAPPLTRKRPADKRRRLPVSDKSKRPAIVGRAPQETTTDGHDG